MFAHQQWTHAWGREERGNGFCPRRNATAETTFLVAAVVEEEGDGAARLISPE